MNNEAEDEPGYWELKRGDVTLATLKESWRDFPWVYCTFNSEPAFEPFRHLFRRSDGSWRGLEAELHKVIASENIHMVTGDGHRLVAFTLAVDNAEARLTFTRA